MIAMIGRLWRPNHFCIHEVWGLENQTLPPSLKTLASNNRAAGYPFKEPPVFESFVQLEFYMLSLKPVHSFTL